MKPKTIGIGILLGVACFALTYSIALLSQERTYDEIIEWPELSASMSSFYSYNWLVMAILANSFAEELVMRVYLIDRLEKLFGKSWIAILVTALLFGSYHIYQGITGLMCATLMGIVFGIHYARYRKLLPIVVAHTIYNLFSYAIYFLYQPYQ